MGRGDGKRHWLGQTQKLFLQLPIFTPTLSICPMDPEGLWLDLLLIEDSRMEGVRSRENSQVSPKATVPDALKDPQLPTNTWAPSSVTQDAIHAAETPPCLQVPGQYLATMLKEVATDLLVPEMTQLVTPIWCPGFSQGDWSVTPAWGPGSSPMT